MPDEQWLDGWAQRLRAAVERALRDVVSAYPYEAGEHEIGPPATARELDELRRRMPWVPDGLIALRRVVGEVSLPDIANGYFLYEPHAEHGRPDRLAEPHAVDVVVFGGDGGGASYAVAVDAPA
ncbi:hypothetical protein, partial [Actinoplanes philippinensis]|uniref:hypothetical protein n=1 Tax=Actinoplanes philippinensis TaxID=35752 RepID=UPI0033CD8EF3